MISLTDIKESHTLFDNHYELIDKIGGGGFSEVWLAHDNVAGIDVALKIYTPNGELNEECRNDFKREFARLCDLNHSNIIHAIGFGIYNDELPYLVMSVCKNGSAKKLIGKIDEDGLWNFIEQVASGLQYLHKRGIIHQDMKPDNVLMNSDGQYLIIDFGISIKTRNTLRKSSKGHVGGGTPWYMSVESFGTETPSVYARDIWAFGASLYEIMTGDVPFGQYGGITQKAQDGKIPAVKQNFSDELKQLVYDCLSLDAWDRPDADQIMQRVHNHKIGITPKKQYHVNNIVYGVFAAMILVVCFWIWQGKKTLKSGEDSTEDIIALNKNDSILIAQIEKANDIIQIEKSKRNILSVTEANLCYAADIYNEAMGLEATDSIVRLGKSMWVDSQEFINNTYCYLDSTWKSYNDIEAYVAAEKFKQRCLSLKNYVSESAINSTNKRKTRIPKKRKYTPSTQKEVKDPFFNRIEHINTSPQKDNIKITKVSD